LCADTGGMQAFGGSRAPSVGVLARADSVAASRGIGGGGGMHRPGTAKLGETFGGDFYHHNVIALREAHAARVDARHKWCRCCVVRRRELAACESA
jgi:hypothetical protein